MGLSKNKSKTNKGKAFDIEDLGTESLQTNQDSVSAVQVAASRTKATEAASSLII
jgi:hypothetical protein